MYYKFSIHFLLSTKVHPHCDPNLASVATFKYDLLDSRKDEEANRKTLLQIRSTGILANASSDTYYHIDF